MFVSFVLATFNCADLAPGLINHLAKMEFQDYEILVSDGGSIDDTVQILAKYAKITIIRSSPDKGIYDAWNYALPYCSGEYIAFLGIDDLPHGNFFHLAKCYCRYSESQPGLIYGDAIRSRGNRIRARITSNPLRFFATDSLVMDFHHPGALTNRQLFKNASFDSSFLLAGDLDFYLGARNRIREMGVVKVNEVQAISGVDGLSNELAAYAIYCDEFKKIGTKRNLDFTGLIHRYNIKSHLRYYPKLFALLKEASWRILGKVQSCDNSR